MRKHILIFGVLFLNRCIYFPANHFVLVNANWPWFHHTSNDWWRVVDDLHSQNHGDEVDDYHHCGRTHWYLHRNKSIVIQEIGKGDTFWLISNPSQGVHWYHGHHQSMWHRVISSLRQTLHCFTIGFLKVKCDKHISHEFHVL